MAEDEMGKVTKVCSSRLKHSSFNTDSRTTLINGKLSKLHGIKKTAQRLALYLKRTNFGG
jgi:hypothetical protein